MSPSMPTSRGAHSNISRPACPPALMKPSACSSPAGSSSPLSPSTICATPCAPRATGAKRADPSTDAARFYQWRLTRGEFRDLVALSGFEVLDIKAIGKRQGVLRSLQHEFGMPYQWFLSKAMSAAIAPVIPSGLVAHMLLAVARKPEA